MGSPTQNKAMLKVLQGFPTQCLERRAFQPTVGNANAQGLSNPDAATNTACKLNSKAFSLVPIGLLACQWVDLEGLANMAIQPALQKNTANLPAVGCSPLSWASQSSSSSVAL